MGIQLTRLQKYYLYYTGSFLPFIAGLGRARTAWHAAALDRLCLPVFHHLDVCRHRHHASRTSDVSEYYVAGRRVPAVFNGMATGADWMSAASFIGLAGTLYLVRLSRGWPT
jgi:cation/acetate symporter